MFLLLPRVLLLIFILQCLLLTLPSQAQEDFSQPFQWRTLESEHFYLHFKLADEVLAKRSINIAEQALIQIANKFNWMPKSRVNLIISNQQDGPNGYATPLPFNYIVIYSPQPSDFNELYDYDEWLKILLIHELTHTVHLDKTAGAPNVFRHIFGRNPLFFPNMFQPTLFKEGIATYIETSWERGIGRGQSAYYDMMMRTEVKRGLLSLNEAQLVADRWPLNAAYLYGVYFYQFIDDVYGAGKVDEYIDVYSRQLIPYFLYKPVRAISQEPGLTSLWARYQTWLIERFTPQIEALEKTTLTPSTAITNTGYFNGKPASDNLGNLYYAKFDANKPSYLVKNQQGREQKLTRVHSNIVIVGVNEDSLWYLQLSSCTHNSQSFDLYRYDFKNWFNSTTKITHCASIVQGKLLNNTEVMAAIIEDNGRQQLITMNVHTLTKKILYHGDFNETLASPNLTIDKQQIILSRKLANEAWHISQFDVASHQFKRIISQAGIDFYTPSLSLDNQFIYYGSDQQGLLEAYRSQLDGSQEQQLTQTLSGVINPVVNADNNTLIFQQYSHNGWNIHQANISENFETTSNSITRSQKLPRLSKPGEGYEAEWLDDTAVNFETYNYTAINSVYPRSWWFGAYNSGKTTEIGISVTGRDSLNFHNYLLGLSWDAHNDVAAGIVSYTLYNHFTLAAGRIHEFTEGSGTNKDTNILKQVVDQASAYFNGYWLYDFSSLSWFAGGIISNEKTYDVQTKQDNILLDDEITTGGVSFVYNSTTRTLDGISESFGRNIKITLEHDDRDINSPSTLFQSTHGALATLDWREYINLHLAHVLAVRGFIGLGEEGIEPFKLGGEKSNLFSLQSPIYDRNQSLRGYSSNLSELSGRKAKLVSAEYRFPLYTAHAGISSWPIGLHKIFGSIFYDTGAASNTDQFNYYSSAGFEIAAQLDLGYALIADVSLGLALPQDTTVKNIDKDPEFYFRFSTGF